MSKSPNQTITERQRPTSAWLPAKRELQTRWAPVALSSIIRHPRSSTPPKCISSSLKVHKNHNSHSWLRKSRPSLTSLTESLNVSHSQTSTTSPKALLSACHVATELWLSKSNLRNQRQMSTLLHAYISSTSPTLKRHTTPLTFHQMVTTISKAKVFMKKEAS